MDFVGQRADKAVVKDVKSVQDVERADGITREGVPKIVEHYTVSCDECGGEGYYDQIGEIICEDCGMVLSGDRPPVIQTDYSEGETAAKGRGVEKMDDTQGTHEPSIDHDTNS